MWNDNVCMFHTLTKKKLDINVLLVEILPTAATTKVRN